MPWDGRSWKLPFSQFVPCWPDSNGSNSSARRRACSRRVAGRGVRRGGLIRHGEQSLGEVHATWKRVGVLTVPAKLQVVAGVEIEGLGVAGTAGRLKRR